MKVLLSLGLYQFGKYVKVSLIGRIIIRGTLVYIRMYRVYGDMLLE